MFLFSEMRNNKRNIDKPDQKISPKSKNIKCLRHDMDLNYICFKNVLLNMQKRTLN